MLAKSLTTLAAVSVCMLPLLFITAEKTDWDKERSWKTCVTPSPIIIQERWKCGNKCGNKHIDLFIHYSFCAFIYLFPVSCHRRFHLCGCCRAHTENNGSGNLPALYLPWHESEVAYYSTRNMPLFSDQSFCSSLLRKKTSTDKIQYSL